MKIDFAKSKLSRNDANNQWIIYILVLTTTCVVNCVLSYYAIMKVSVSNQMFAFVAFAPMPIYLLETLLTRKSYIAIFSEIKDIRAALTSSSKREHVMQLSWKSIIKIIFLLLMFTIQLAIISVKWFIYETVDTNTWVSWHNYYKLTIFHIINGSLKLLDGNCAIFELSPAYAICYACLWNKWWAAASRWYDCGDFSSTWKFNRSDEVRLLIKLDKTLWRNRSSSRDFRKNLEASSVAVPLLRLLNSRDHTERVSERHFHFLLQHIDGFKEEFEHHIDRVHYEATAAYDAYCDLVCRHDLQLRHEWRSGKW